VARLRTAETQEKWEIARRRSMAVSKVRFAGKDGLVLEASTSVDVLDIMLRERIVLSADCTSQHAARGGNAERITPWQKQDDMHDA
jgi:hypothetical protein